MRQWWMHYPIQRCDLGSRLRGRLTRRWFGRSILINFATESFDLVFDSEFPTLEVDELQVVNGFVKHCLRQLIFQSLVALLQFR
jgi:hypothetical protein